MAGSISSMPAFAQSSVSLPGVANPYAAANYYSSPAQPYANSPPRAAAAPTPPAVPPRGHGYSNSVSSYTSAQPGIAPLPRASIHPGAGTRRQSSYDNQQYSGAFNGPTRASIDYPQAHALAQVPQPPPAAASHSLDRIDARPHHARNSSLRVTDQQLIPNSGVRFWTNSKLGITGLKNLGK
jgi:ubiquitin carboxyl-terminal hydrolase 8